MLLGRETLFKWLSMLLFTSRKDDGTAVSLLEKSLIRARLLERMGSYRGNKVEAEHLFLTGMFSMLDVLLGVPFPDVLDPLELASPVREAVVEHRGMFAPSWRWPWPVSRATPSRSRHWPRYWISKWNW